MSFKPITKDNNAINQSRGELHSTANTNQHCFGLIFQLNWTRTFLRKPHSFTFSRFTTRKTTNHTRNWRPTTHTVRGGLGMRWLRERGILFIHRVRVRVMIYSVMLIGPCSCSCVVFFGQSALLSQSVLLCTLQVECEPVKIPRARTCDVFALCHHLDGSMWGRDNKTFTLFRSVKVTF